MLGQRRGAVGLAVLVVAVAASPLARAEDVNTTCYDAYVQGQRLRKQGKLAEARQQFVLCGGDNCPAISKTDCTRWRDEIDHQNQAQGPTTAPPVATASNDARDQPTAPSDRGPRDVDTRWAIAGMLGFTSDNLNFGLGVRGGKTLANRIYIGGTFVYNVGESVTLAFRSPVTGLITSESAGYSLFYLGPEGGYDIDLKHVILRPYLGLGLAFVNESISGPYAIGGGSLTTFVLWPGATVIYDFPGTMWFVSGDLRILIVPGNSDVFGTAFGVFAGGGVKFGS
jgi:hypothetical protein